MRKAGDSWQPRTLGTTQFLVIAMTLTLLAGLVAWAVLSPAFYLHYCEHYYLPSVEQAFGFHAGRVGLPGRDEELVAVTKVETGGAFDQAGFRPGDIPVDHHGGLNRLCGAVRYAAEGGQATVAVINTQDWAQGWAARRELQIRAPQTKAEAK